MNTTVTMTGGTALTALTALTEPFAFALLQWPALVGVLALEGSGWPRVVRIALAAWLVLMVIAAYLRPRGFAFGNAMVFLLACVAGAWWAWPGPWVLAWLPPVMVGLLAAQQLRLRDVDPQVIRHPPTDTHSAPTHSQTPASPRA